VQGAISRGFDVPWPLDCQSDVRRNVFLPKQKSQSPSILLIVDSQTLTSGAFNVPLTGETWAAASGASQTQRTGRGRRCWIPNCEP
jgi:hypothetical protein